jgi:hypothetical protein
LRSAEQGVVLQQVVFTAQCTGRPTSDVQWSCCAGYRHSNSSKRESVEPEIILHLPSEDSWAWNDPYNKCCWIACIRCNIINCGLCPFPCSKANDQFRELGKYSRCSVHRLLYFIYVTIINLYKHWIIWILYVLRSSFHKTYLSFLNCVNSWRRRSSSPQHHRRVGQMCNVGSGCMYLETPPF